MHINYKVTQSNTTLFEVLKQELNMSYKLINKLKKNNKILLNNVPTYKNAQLNFGDYLDIYIDFEEDNSNIVATEIQLDILFEDDALLIVNKPSNMPVHPSMLHYENTLSNGVKYYFDKIGLNKKIRIVNRLDKDTSGIVIFAKNEYIQECLIRQMNSFIFKKEYIAIVEGIPKESYGTINAPIARKTNSIIEREVNYTNGDKAITHYRVLKQCKNLSLLHINLETGRTHQIRVHFSYIGCPILADSLYGKTSSLINRQALHASTVSFIHPITKKNIVITAKIPEDMKRIQRNYLQ